ncbi:hypothetical protein LJC17_04450 [Acholeplasma sp. OttesenSCG-928-E16]|nr:hypothetical protein [Acholeplasma sp. OttesenSCG-928-E16]
MKKLFLCILLVTLLLAGCYEPNNNDNPPKVNKIEKEQLHGDYVYWHGRHHYQNDLEYFYHTATGFRVSFTGRVIIINFELSNNKNDVYFSISKDGSSLLEDNVFILSNESKTLTISFETFESHSIEVIKRSEPEDGTTSLKSIETNGYLTEYDNHYQDKPHFLLVGASGISGHGALGEPGESRTTKNSSSLHSFGFLSANHYQGTYEFVSNSGWGLAFGYNDKSGKNNILNAYSKIGISYNQQIIDIDYPSRKTPDIVIVNIGGNDYSAVINQLVGPAKEAKIQEFKNAVASFILKIREEAPNAHIFWTMTSGSLNGKAAGQVFELLDKKDKDYVHMVTILGVAEGGDLAGANNHCSYLTHTKSANLLIDEIDKYLI